MGRGVPVPRPGAGPPRVAVLWCPDCPVTAAAQQAKLPPDAAISLVSKNLVYACPSAARAEGVARGLRVREAQARLPELTVLEYDPDHARGWTWRIAVWNDHAHLADVGVNLSAD